MRRFYAVDPIKCQIRVFTSKKLRDEAISEDTRGHLFVARFDEVRHRRGLGWREVSILPQGEVRRNLERDYYKPARELLSNLSTKEQEQLFMFFMDGQPAPLKEN